MNWEEDILCFSAGVGLVLGGIWLVKLMKAKSQGSLTPEPTCIGPSIVEYAETFLGTPYVWGGTSPNGFDCSGFTQYVFDYFGVSLPRVSFDQYQAGTPVSEGDLQEADLVFFSTYEAGASHVGIYVGNNLMIDAEDAGVVYDDITNSYWAPKYLGARRVISC
jgi:cell wall-associated NlpC family hydrolase